MKSIISLRSLYAGVFCLTAVLGIQSCRNSSSAVDDGNEVIVFDDLDIEAHDQLNLEDYDIILLSSDNEDCLLRRNSKTVVHDGCIYILDGLRATETKLAVFDLQGNAIGTIGSRGQGPEEYARLSDFFITNDGSVNIYDPGVKILKYDAEGNYTGSTPIEIQNKAITQLPNGNFLVSVALWDVSSASPYSLVLTDSSFNVIEGLVHRPENFDTEYGSGSSHMYANNNGQYAFNGDFSNDIHIINSEGKPERVIAIDFGALNFPDDEKVNLYDHEDRLLKYRYIAGPVFYEEGHLWFSLVDRMSYKWVHMDIDNKAAHIYDANSIIKGYHNGYPIITNENYEAGDFTVSDSLEQKIEEGDYHILAIHK